MIYCYELVNKWFPDIPIRRFDSYQEAVSYGVDLANKAGYSIQDFQIIERRAEGIEDK